MNEANRIDHPSISTSPSLIQRVQEREHDAWDRFVHIYTPLLYHWVHKVVSQDSDVADLLQEVFQAIASSVEKYDPNKGSGFRGWLWGITQNKLAQFRRVQMRHPQAHGGSAARDRMEEIPDQPPSDPREEAVILARRAADLIRSDFAPKTFKAFWLITVENHSAKDVAQELGMTVAAVYKAKSRVLAHLRNELEFPADL